MVNFAARFATPAASDGSRGGVMTANMTGQSLPQMVNSIERFPTPRVCENDQGRGADAMSDGVSSWKAQGRGATLTTAVRRMPTPTKSDHKGGGPSMVRKDGKMRGDRLDYATERKADGTAVGGALNPTWVEWLMGWPLGWTDLRDLEMDRFRQWCGSHGRRWPGEKI